MSCPSCPRCDLCGKQYPEINRWDASEAGPGEYMALCRKCTILVSRSGLYLRKPTWPQDISMKLGPVD